MTVTTTPSEAPDDRVVPWSGERRGWPAALQWWPILEYQLRLYRRNWRGSIIARALSPLLFLLSMGVGVGSLVDARTGGLPWRGESVPYLPYVVPAIAAVTAMQTAVGESTWPVLGAIRWNRVYHAMLATPARVVDLLRAHAAYLTVQLTVASILFVVIAVPFGGFRTVASVLVIPVCVLTGLSFALPIVALAAKIESDTAFSVVYRLGATPLMLFSGTFFPVERLPVAMQPLAWATPLWHGVEACRLLALGAVEAGELAGRIGILLGFCAVGWLLAQRSLSRRLAR